VVASFFGMQCLSFGCLFRFQKAAVQAWSNKLPIRAARFPYTKHPKVAILRNAVFWRAQQLPILEGIGKNL
jgi:hypothetical protein